MTDIDRIVKLYKDEMDFDLDNLNNLSHPFCENFQVLLKLEPKSIEYNYILFHCLFGPLEYLATIKKTNYDDWEEWRKRLINNTKNVGLYGDIFELHINWTMVQKNIEFKKRERPDFSITHNNKEIYIECTSAHFDFDKTPTEREIFKKLKGNVRSKIIENYMNLSTIVFVDVTNLYYHSKSIDNPLNNETLRKLLIEIDENLIKNPPKNEIKPLGAIAFFFFDNSQNKETHFSTNILSYFKRPDAETNLIDFIEKNFLKNIEKSVTKNPKFNH